MVASIPARSIVDIIPNVLSAGGTGLDLSGLFLTTSTRVPIGTVQTFTSAASVGAFFGLSSAEYAQAVVYFAGPDNATIRPAQMLFSQYPTTAVPAYLRGGTTGLTLAQLVALANGTITLSFNGTPKTSGTINLSTATSFSNAATLIQTALGQYDAVVTGSITATTLTVSAVTSGALAVGQVISGAGVTAGTTITALGTGTGGAGTYTVSPTQTASSTTISAGPAAVTYDSQSGAFVITSGTPGVTSTIGYATVGALATSLGLTAATGAVLSQGAAVATPATAMAAIIAQTQNFATFTTIFEPSTSDCVAFAAWNNGQEDRYAYICWDTDAAAYTANDTTSAGYLIGQADYSGTILIYEPSELYHAAFVMSVIAALDFARTDGRKTLAFQGQSGLAPAVTNQTIADQLITNGYNFVGSYATANDQFTFFNNGSITGPFLWADSYVNQIWLNNGFQLALMELLTTVGSIPYNINGYALIETAIQDQIDQALSFGAIRAGVTLSSLQVSQINALVGLDVADVITQRGWYLSIQDATPQVRAARGSPPCTFFYADGQSVQKITLSSVEVQ